MTINLHKNPTNPSLSEVAYCLKSGGVALLPTDTVYGLAASLHHENATKSIFKIKNRPEEKNLPILVSKVEQLIELNVDLNQNVRALTQSPLVPGALTIVSGINYRNHHFPSLREREEVAFRIPKHDLLLKVIDQVGPLLVTSANVSGQDTRENIERILQELKMAPDIIYNDGPLGKISSTIVNCRHEKPIIEREGLITEKQLAKYLE